MPKLMQTFFLEDQLDIFYNAINDQCHKYPSIKGSFLFLHKKWVFSTMLISLEGTVAFLCYGSAGWCRLSSTPR